MASDLVTGESHREADEFMTVEPRSLSAALSMIETGEIEDAKTALGLLYAAGFIAGR
jgi:ADP-ribose pyrophosphatase